MSLKAVHENLTMVTETSTHSHVIYICVISLQVWASNFLPNELALAESCQKDFLQKHGEPMLVQYARMEAEAQVMHNSQHLSAQ